ncbi:10890_t:CDS:2 [Acaulospora morrowiae]|uniref:10890_t:CDS:1 n=1 Tax=Acaulospora morrowiae TaxID=94023 RepID=A0A9N9BPG1_9GLOM|nr:10890_t:CDS:2 [Acaulospora morrowiae]
MSGNRSGDTFNKLEYESKEAKKKKDVLILKNDKKFANKKPRIDLKDLMKEEQESITKFLEKKKRLYAKELSKLIQTDMIQYKIDISDIKLIKQEPYRA